MFSPENCAVPSDVVMDELKKKHINTSPGDDGWPPRIRRGGRPPRSAGQRSKGEHEMAISHDNQDAYAF